MPQTAPYGSWPSPIDAALAASHDGRPDNVATVGDEVWWTEPRPDEGGRRVLVRLRPDGREESVLPAPWNVRTRVIEYGGRPWAGTVRPDGSLLVVFAHFPDQRLYAYEPDGDAPPRPLTPAPAEDGRQTGTLRWADPQLRLADGEVWCVLEEFTGESPTDVRRVVAAVPLDGSAADDRAAVRELSDDRHRFVTGPRVSPDGRHVAWIAWDHPECLGTARSCCSPTSLGAAPSNGSAPSPEARRSPSPRPTGRQTARSCTSPTPATGGSSTGCGSTRQGRQA